METDMDSGENLQRCRREYVDALEEERRKIQVFPRELPLCLELVTRAIDACRNQLSESESSAKPFNFVSTERAPLTSSSSDLDDEDKENDENGRSTNKSDWLQLWNPQVGDPQAEKGDIPGKSSILMDGRKNCGAFKPFQRERDTAGVRGNNNNNNSTAAPASGRRNPPAVSSSAETVATVARSSSCSVGSRRELVEKEAHSMSSQRKARRCWSPELHRRFLNALQQLGGAQAATPKQIREFMKVDGLTNDEVKSHLQKYRLHNSKPSSSLNHGDNGGAQAPHHLMAVGGRWGKPPPPENNGAAVAEATSPEGLGAAAPAHLLKLGGCDEERASHSCELGGGGGGCSGSPSTSCSTPLPVV